MNIVIHIKAPEPVYEQLVRQIHAGVQNGELKAGEALPTVRQLAADLQVNRNTVARAYKLLEDQGVILTATSKGSFVSTEAAQAVTRLRYEEAQRRVRQLVQALMGEGLHRDQITALFNDALLGGFHE
jgi:GntR family transcriptional regulator